jgi:DNA primase
MSGAVVAAHGRIIDPAQKNKLSAGPIGAGVYWTPGAYVADPLVITEAPIDALSLAAVGLPAIALCGKGVKAWAPKAFAGKRVLLAFDADQPGDDAAEEWKAALRFGTYAKRLRPEGGEGGKDWNAMLMAHGPDGLADYLDRALRLIHP